MICKKCGAEIDNNTKFCAACGSAVEEQNTQPVNNIFTQPIITDESTPSVQPMPANEPTPSVQPMPASEPTPSVQPMPTSEPTPSVQPMPTSEPTPSIEPMPTSEPTPSIEPMPTSEPAPSIEPMPTNEPTPSVQPMPASEPTPSIEPMPASEPSEPKKKKNVLLPIFLIVLLLGGALAGAYFYLNNTKRIVTKMINGAYDKFEELVYDKATFDYENKSALVKGDLTFETNIDELKEISGEKISYTFGIDYKNKKLEAGASLTEDNTKIIDAMLYVLNDTGYLSLKDDYASLLKIDNENFDFSEIFNIDKTRISQDDIKYIIDSYKKIVSESIDANDFTKSTATIKINDKDTKVNKLNYVLDQEKYQKVMSNIITKTLEDSKLLEILAKVSETDVSEIKDELNYIKENIKDEEFEGKYNISIYTNPVTSIIVGLDITYEGSEGLIAVRFSKGLTTIDITDGTNKIASATIKQPDDNTYNINVNLPEEKVAADIVLSSKETSKDNYEGSFKIKVTYDGQYASLETKYTTSIGATIADVDTSTAKNISEITEEEYNEITNKIVTRFENSKIYNALNNLFNSTADYGNEIYDGIDYSL